jgi:SpoVK/Ycf46/Vps4 family AAA+-type ATPase
VKATFEDIHITPDAIEALDSILLPLRMPDQFKVGILAKCPPTGLLLYGPPGTGKTLFVKALAKKTEATLLSLSGADIRSKYVSEGQKKIRDVFACARQWNGPFVIFIDEADALFHRRSSELNSRGHLDDINQFLAEMDGINSSGLLNVMVVVATNRPFDIDEGILRRLGRRIFIDIPDMDGREAILKIHLKGETLGDDVNLAELAKRTYDYTGSDLRDLVYSAALTAVRDMVNSPKPTQFADQPPAQPRVLRWKHFLHAKKQIRASPKSETAEKIREFHTKFGNTAQRSASEHLGW